MQHILTALSPIDGHQRQDSSLEGYPSYWSRENVPLLLHIVTIKHTTRGKEETCLCSWVFLHTGECWLCDRAAPKFPHGLSFPRNNSTLFLPSSQKHLLQHSSQVCHLVLPSFSFSSTHSCHTSFHLYFYGWHFNKNETHQHFSDVNFNFSRTAVMRN